MKEDLRRVLSALYAPGLGLAPVRGWPAVVQAIRRADPAVSSRDALAHVGLALEALLLETAPDDPPEGLLTAIDEGLAALLPLAGRIARGLPASAVEISLDAPTLPPAVWAYGELPAERTPTVGGIGCRRPSPAARDFALMVGALAARRGITLVSGGAEGCDTAFALGHASAIALLPHGLDYPRDLNGTAARLSPFPRAAPFSRERAMRRNALIVAAADLVLVASARLKEGGSWHAALGALRRRAPLAVYLGPGEGSGARALVALGALPVRDPEEALAALALIRELCPHEDAAARWSDLTGRPDGRVQPTLMLNGATDR